MFSGKQLNPSFLLNIFSYNMTFISHFLVYKKTPTLKHTHSSKQETKVFVCQERNLLQLHIFFPWKTSGLKIYQLSVKILSTEV